MSGDFFPVVRRSVPIAVLIACTLVAQDDCSTAIPIATGLTSGSTVGLTTNTVVSCGTLHRDVWYSWSSACNGTTTATLCSPGTASFDTIIAAWDGSAGCSSLVLLACNDDWCGARSSINFQTSIGGTYYLAVGGATTTTGSFTLSLGCAPAVPNDDCATALPISNGITIGSNIGATSSIQTGGCSNMGSDVWYVYTPPCSGVAEATFCQPGSATFDTMLAVFAATGSCPNLVQLACNDDTCLLSSTVLFPVVAGGSYLLAVGGFAALQGTFALSLTCHQPPPNDDCAGALPLALGINGPFSNQFATDGLAPPSACAAGFGDLWFTFAPTCSGLHKISTCGGGYDTIVSILAGGCGASAEIACNDDDPSGACGAGSVATFAASSGVTYLVRVAGGTSSRGSFNVIVTHELQITYSSLLGPGSVAFAIEGGTPNGLYFDAVTFTAGAFPNGAFYGIDISGTELNDELTTGYPFFSALDACGSRVFPPTLVPAFSGLTFYSVVLTSDVTITLPIVSTQPTSYTIP